MRRQLWALVPIVLVMAGCAHARPGARPPAKPVPIHGHWATASCPATANAPIIEPSAPPPPLDVVLPSTFQVAWVLRCVNQVEPGWFVMATQRADTPATDLIAQLEAPPDPPVNGLLCTDDFVVPPYFAFVDSTGKAFAPEFPRDQCAKPRASVVKALDALPFRTVATTPVRQIG